ncbi:MAG: AAA family ATPase [Acidilobus sp.]
MIVGRIFSDRRVFEETYVPRTLPVRDQEAETLLSRYTSRFSEGPGATDVTVIYGSIGRVGIGKTTLAKYVAYSLQEHLKGRGVILRPVYINVYGAPSIHQMLSSVVSELGVNIPVRGTAAIEMLKAITDYLYIKDSYALVVLDEFQSLLMSNRLSNEDLYMLLRVYEEIPPKDNVNRLNFLLVSQDFRVLSYMRERIPQVESQIGFKVYLKPYSAEELRAILEQRAALGLVDSAWSDDVIGMIADYYGYSERGGGGDGSARRAILTLRMAAEMAEAEGASRITEEHVRRAISADAISNIPLEVMRSLNLHELLILMAVSTLIATRGGWLSTGEVKGEYESLARAYGEEPRRHTQFYEYLKELSNAGLLEARVSNLPQRGRTTMVRLPPEIPADRLREVVESIIMDRAGGPKVPQ